MSLPKKAMERMSKKCPKCDSGNVHITQYPNPRDNMATCYACGCAGMEEDFPEQTLFDRITASPEVLAEELVTTSYDEFKDCTVYWAWLGNGRREAYCSKPEAIAATVARLKGVCK